MKSIYIFRRDFRTYDNLALIECVEESSEILPIFIFTPEQINPKKNPYFSNNAVQFMVESLIDLDNNLDKVYHSKLHYFTGDNIDVLKRIREKYDFQAIYYNRDYTPYARRRDEEIEKWAAKNNIIVKTAEDYLLMPMGTFLKEDKTPYLVYGPFKKSAKLTPVPQPIQQPSANGKFIKRKDIHSEVDLNEFFTPNSDIIYHGGRQNALLKIQGLNKFKNYADERNDLTKSTTNLSAYIKFGCLSIREVYHKILKLFGINHGLIDQLYWREFYFYLVYYIPRVLEGKGLKEKYDKIKWGNNPDSIRAWKEGKTGFPVVDAAMREMNTTGFMHNRGRLITSAILIKILNCDWRIGEEYFATQLVDYDPSVNNGNWQWGAGCGADSQPYFRIFNPWTQAKDYDPDCIYIKRWVPELKDVPCKDIHNWDKTYSKYQKSTKYPGPIVDYKEARVKIMDVYKKALYH